MSEVKHYKVTEPWLDIHCGLGEAPFWDRGSNTLRFVDIVKKQLHTVDLNQGVRSHKMVQLTDCITTTANIEGNDKEFVFGGKAGVGIMNKKTNDWHYIAKYWSDDEVKDGKEKRMRGNDGAVDTKGRYWVHTMNDPTVADPSKEGVVFRLDPDLKLHRVHEPVTIPNGTSWSPDDKTMYFTDSPTQCIEKFAYDPLTGDVDLSKGEVFFKSPIKDAVPDGHCTDAEGCFWIALFHGGKVVRVNTKGEIIAEVELPTRCPSCPGICGEDLYITSAEEEDPDNHPDSVKYQGAVFKVHIGVGPSTLNEFKMQAKA